MLFLAWATPPYNIHFWQYPRAIVSTFVYLKFGDPVADRIWLEKPLKVSFQTNGYTFYKGAKSGEVGLPTEAFLKLIAVKKMTSGEEEKIRLPRTTSLKGFVTIKTEQDALEMVRLFTSPDTHYLFDNSHWLEIDHSADRKKYFLAWLCTEDFNQLGLFNPKVRKENHRFVVERCLLNSHHEIVKSQETVGEDGGYAILIKEIVGTHDHLVYPRYE